MRPLSFRPDGLRKLLLRNKIATLDELKQALGTTVDVTVFRKLKLLDYLTSYSHRGRYYTLREIALFDDHGLWFQAEVWFSRFGTLLATAEGFVHRSPRGYFADELAPALHVEVQDALHQLTQQGRVSRQIVSGRYLYTAIDQTVQRRQLLARRTVEFPAHGRGCVRSGGLPGRSESRHPAVLQSAGRAATSLVRRTGVPEVGPWRGPPTGRLPRPRSTHCGPWTIPVTRSRRRSGPCA
jgi:hypothetical protein